MSRPVIRPYDFLIEPEGIFDAAEGRPFRLIAADSVSAESGAFALASLEASVPPLTDERGSFGGVTLARGAAVWQDTIFIADPARHRVLSWQPCREIAPIPAESPTPEGEPADCALPDAPPPTPGGRELRTPVALAISARDDLIVVDAAYRRLLLFTLPGYALRRVIDFPACPPAWSDRAIWQPVDAAVGPRGAIFVLDASGFVWKFDARYRIDTIYNGGLPADAIPERIAVDAAGRAYVVAALPDRRAVFVLDRWGRLLPDELTALDNSVDPADADAPTLRDILTPSRLALDGRHITLLPDPCKPPPRDPITTPLEVDDGGHLVLVDAPTDPPYAIFVPPTLTYPPTGALIVELDSRKLGNVWHRVAVEREILDRTGVILYARTSDQPLIGLTTAQFGDAGWSASPNNADEWLIQSPPGQYLYLGVKLVAPGDRTPAVERLYVYRERHSSLQFLPATYQADEISRSVLDRLLSLFDTVYGEIETAIEAFPVMLDVAGAPPEFLSWLASWFDLLLEQTWTDAQRRDVLRHLMELYHWRGTRRGIELLVRLHTGVAAPLPRIVEHYKAGTTAAPGSPVGAWLNAPEVDLLGIYDPTYHVSIVLPAYLLKDDERTAALRRLLDSYLPAHVHYTLRPMPAGGFRVGCDTGALVGVDTLVATPADWQLSSGGGLLDVGALLPDAPLPPAVIAQVGRTRLRRRESVQRPCVEENC